MFMKKKFINGLLLAAAFVVASGSMISCKDLEEDRFQEFQEKNRAQITIITKDNLKALADSMAAVRRDMKTWKDECHAKCQTYVNNQLTKYATIAYVDKKVNDRVDSLDTQINNKLTIIEGKLTTLKIWVGDTLAQYYVGSKIDKLLAGKADTSSVYTRAQIDAMLAGIITEADVNNMLKEYYNKNEVDSILNNYYTQTQINNLFNDYYTIHQIDSIKKQYFTKTEIIELMDSFATKDWINNNFYNKDSIDNKIRNFITQQEALDAVENAINDATSGINQAIRDIQYGTDEQMTVDEIVDSYFFLQEVVMQVAADAEEAVQWVRTNAEEFVKHRLEIERLSDLAEMMQHQILDIQSEIFDLKNDMSQVWAKLICDGDTVSYADLRADVDSLFRGVKKNTDNVDSLEVAFKAADKEMEDSIDALRTRVDDLDARLTKVENTIKKMVTSIVIQAVENPVFGEAALPLGLQTNMLIARYGYVKNTDVTFPAPSIAPYVSGATVTPADIAGAPSMSFNKDQYLYADAENNAGTVYVTVNPNTADFAGKTLKIVNSQGTEAGITLGALKSSSKVLGWGVNYTRANNGFYEAPAKLTDINAASLRYDATTLKGAAAAIKQLLTRSNPENDAINAGKIARAIYKNMSNFADRYGLEATYEDGDGNEHTVVSDYGIAAIALRGLPFDFADGFSLSHVPGITAIENLIDKVVEKAINELKTAVTNVNIPSTTVKNITLVNFDDQFNGKFKVTITYAKWTDANHNGIVDAGEIAEVTETFDISADVKDLYDYLKDEIEDVNQMVDAINKYITDMQGIFTGVADNFENAGDKIKQFIFDYIDLIDEKLAPYMSPSMYLQPLLIVKTENGFARATQSKTLPAKINQGSCELIATSYSAEILAPAYKKFARVTNAWKAADMSEAADKAAAANSASTNFNEVLPGETNLLHFRGGESGYIYEVLYEAMDYNGQIVAQKYYVQVK